MSRIAGTSGVPSKKFSAITWRRATLMTGLSLHGGRDVATFVARAEKDWPLATARSAGYRPRRLLAIMKTSHVIAGDGDLVLQAPVLDDRFVLSDPGNDDPRGVKGMLLDLGNASLGNLVTWISDIRGAFF